MHITIEFYIRIKWGQLLSLWTFVNRTTFDPNLLIPTKIPFALLAKKAEESLTWICLTPLTSAAKNVLQNYPLLYLRKTEKSPTRPEFAWHRQNVAAKNVHDNFNISSLNAGNSFSLSQTSSPSHPSCRFHPSINPCQLLVRRGAYRGVSQV